MVGERDATAALFLSAIVRVIAPFGQVCGVCT